MPNSMLNRLRRTQVFVSYSRKDDGICKALVEHLETASIDSFVDTEGVLIGEKFAQLIQEKLKKSDGVIALITEDSATSPWCQAELYQAHALGKPIASVLIGVNLSSLPRPLELFLEELNYIEIEAKARIEDAAQAIERSLKEMKRRHRLRALGWAGAIAAAAAATSLAIIFVPSQINSLSHAKNRERTLERVMDSSVLLRPEALTPMAGEFANDEELLARLKIVESDGERTDIQRTNAGLLSGAVQALGGVGGRRYLESVDWSDASFAHAQFDTVTFSSGALDRVDFSDSTFSAVAWSPGPTQSSDGFSLTGSVFDSCQFHGGWFSQTQAISVKFRNCRLYGTQLDLLNFEDVEFATEPEDPTGTVISNDYSGIIRCVVMRCTEDDDEVPGQVIITPQRSGTRFKGVVFEDCVIRGDLPSHWFVDCNFTNCILPPALTEASLESGGNSVTGSVWFEPHCW